MTIITYTRQEAFDKAARGIINQKGPSMGPKKLTKSGSYVCRYRSTVGKKCAAGHLIPDDLYSPSMEGRSVTVLPISIEPLGVVHSLQSAHDTAAEIPHNFFKRWKEQMHAVADKWDVDPSILYTIEETK